MTTMTTMTIVKEKRVRRKFTKHLHLYMLLTQTRTVTRYEIDPFCRQGERPHDEENHVCFDYSQNLVVSPIVGSMPRLTD